MSFEDYLYEKLYKINENVPNEIGITLIEMQYIYKEYAKLPVNAVLYDDEIYTIYYTVETLKHLNKVKVIFGRYESRYVIQTDQNIYKNINNSNQTISNNLEMINE